MKKIFTLLICIFMVAAVVSACSKGGSNKKNSAAPTYTVTYEGNGATGGTVPVDENEYEENESVSVQDNTGSLEKTWYNFSWWNTAADGSGTTYTAGESFEMGTSDVSLYVMWEPKTWGTAELIETVEGNEAKFPQIAVDPNGNAIAVWHQVNGAKINIYANRYVAGTGWGAEVLIDNNAGAAEKPQVAVDPEGNAIAVWYQNDGAQINIYANRYVAGTGWEGAMLIENNAGAAYYYPQVAVDPSGNAVAVWSQNDGIQNSIFANRYITGTGWEGAVTIEDGVGGAWYPQVAFDQGGNAIAA